MPEINVVGLGPGPVELLTLEAQRVLALAKQVYFRFSAHPVFEWVRKQGVECISFDYIYLQPHITYDRIYRLINKALIKVAKRDGQCVYALPGNPYVFEKGPRWLKEMAEPEGVAVKITPGLSFLETLYIELGVDPEEGLQILNAARMVEKDDYPFTPALPLLIGQVGLPVQNRPDFPETNLKLLAQLLLQHYPKNHPVTLIWSSALPAYQNLRRSIALEDLAGQDNFVKTLATLLVPPLPPPPAGRKK
jgi:tetrapyrrole methylase family protein/MazG family protein